LRTICPGWLRTELLLISEDVLLRPTLTVFKLTHNHIKLQFVGQRLPGVLVSGDVTQWQRGEEGLWRNANLDSCPGWRFETVFHEVAAILQVSLWEMILLEILVFSLQLDVFPHTLELCLSLNKVYDLKILKLGLVQWLIPVIPAHWRQR
jgi:hypothetical protein